MECPKCKANNPEGTRFCTACGSAMIPAAPQKPEKVAKKASVALPKDKFLMIILLAVIVVAVVVVILLMSQPGPAPVVDQTDEHGCLIAQGYSWCEAKQACLAPGEECQVAPPEPECGDGECNGDETCSDCPDDCGYCAPRCGDEECNGDETCTTCPLDCGDCPAECGDGECSVQESCFSCPKDCGRCPELTLCSNAQYKTTRTAQGIELTEDSKTRLMERLEDKPNFSLQGIRYLSCLQILDLSDTRISDTSDLVNLNNLRWLDLEGTQISDVSYFKNMTYLEELNLKGTKVYDPSPLLTLASLRKLDLRDTLISEGNCIDLKDTLTNTQVYCEGPCEEGYMFSEETCKCIPDPDGCKNLGKEECAQNMGCYSFSRSGRCGCPNCELLLSHVCLPK